MKTGCTTQSCAARSRTEGSGGRPAAATALAVALLVLGVAAGARAASDDAVAWRSHRHDGRQTRTSPGKARLDKAPAARWRSFLGGTPAAATTADLDFDGEDDVIAIESGAVVARRATGQLMWRTGPIGASGLLGRPRIDADGRRGVGVRRGDGVVVLRLDSGKVVFETAPGATATPVLVQFADADGDGVDELFLADNGGHAATVDGAVRVIRLEDGVVVAQTPAVDPSGEPASGALVGVVDVDGDGHADVFGGHQTAPGEGVVFAYRGSDAKPIALGVPKEGRSCGQVLALPRDGKSPMLVCAANFGAASGAWAFRGVAAYERVAGQFHRRWLWQVADQANDIVSLPIVGGDLDGDGSMELLAATRVGGAWQTQAWDGGTFAALKAGPLPLRRLVRAGAPAATLLLGDVDGPGGGVNEASALGRWRRDEGVAATWQLGAGIVGAIALAQPDGADAGLALWRASDSDGDDAADRVELLAVDAAGKASVVASRDFASPVSVAALGRGVSGAADGAGSGGLAAVRLLACERSGAGWWLDAALAARNDADGDGVPALRYGVASDGALRAAPLTVGGSDWRVVVAEAGHVRVLDAAGADPVVPPKATSLWRGVAGLTRATLADVDGDGAREYVLRTTAPKLGPVLRVLETDGAQRWAYQHADDAARWSVTNGDAFALVDVDGDGGEDILATYAGSGAMPTAGWRTMVRGKDGAALWKGDNPCVTGVRQQLAVEDDGVSPATGLLSLFYTRVRCALATGALLDELVTKGPVQYGVPVITALANIPGLSAVFASAFGGVAAERSDHTLIWGEKSKDFSASEGALVHVKDAGGVATAVLITSRGNRELLALDAATGATLWSARYAGGARLADDAPAPPSLFGPPIGVADLRGEGAPSVLLASSDGILYAIAAADGDVEWTRDYGGGIGNPIVADIDADGELEILLTTPSGDLEALDRDVLARPAWVRDNDGAGPALGDAADIDVSSDSSTLHANWAEVPDADGYFVRVVDDLGGEITPRADVGATTSASVGDLLLQTGERYRVEVRAYRAGRDGGGGIESQPEASDGVRVEDGSDPEILALSADPAGGPSGASFALTLVAHDQTRLAALELVVRDGDGVQWARFAAPTGKRDATLAAIWESVDGEGAGLGVGTYRVEAVVADAAGKTAQATLPLVLCAAGEAYVDGSCGPPTGAPGSGNGGELDEGGCGCSVRGGGAGPSAGSALILLLLGLALARAYRPRGYVTERAQRR